MTQATTDLADIGWTKAMHLMNRGQLRDVQLWRREAFDRYRTALVDGHPDPAWLEGFNDDLARELGCDLTAAFINPGEVELLDGESAVAVVKLTRKNGDTATFVIRPGADQAIRPIMRLRIFP